MKTCFLQILTCIVLSSARIQASADFDVKAHYNKSEYRIPMRDGIRLYTAVYSPKDTSQSYPILMVRTPYSAGPREPDDFLPPDRIAPSDDFLEEGYIFVFQDARGTFGSEGGFINLRPVRDGEDGIDETTDTYDTIDWLINNIPGNNGRVGQWGISYPAWYTVMGMINSHPALKAASPQATTFDAFIGDDFHFNGAFLVLASEWSYSMSLATGPDRGDLKGSWPAPVDHGTPWAYDFYLNAGPTDELNDRHYHGRMTRLWQELIDHPDYDDYWKKRNSALLLGDVTVPVLNVAGWFDSPDPYGTIATYRAIEQSNPGNRSTLVVGPWRHGGWRGDDGSKWGDIDFGQQTSVYFRKEIMFPFFQYYLKGVGNWLPSEVLAFETGGNRWHKLDEWPPENIAKKNVYFGESQRLTFDEPREKGEDTIDAFVSDPAKPVPFSPVIRMNEIVFNAFVGDQRFASTRPDVLTYQTDVLDKDITIAGAVQVNLFASTSGTDGDWFVKLIDVYPNDAEDTEDVEMGGYQMLLAIDVMRGKYRKSFSMPEPMVAGEVTPIRFEMRDRYHTFRKGHRIMVHIQGSWFPVVDRNPNKFTSIYRARKDDYQKATQNIHRSPKYPSHLVLPVIE